MKPIWLDLTPILVVWYCRGSRSERPHKVIKTSTLCGRRDLLEE